MQRKTQWLCPGDSAESKAPGWKIRDSEGTGGCGGRSCTIWVLPTGRKKKLEWREELRERL